jgi:lipopolysaccharide export system ATP-binding protein
MESLIAEFSLEHIRTNRGDLLSGERRRTEIARCLATDPKFIYLTNLCRCRSSSRRRYSIVAQLKDKNIGILITDHNVQETLAITDKTYLMFEGGILKQEYQN